MLVTDEQVGARVRALRKARKMSLREVAGEIGLSFTFLGHLERGEKPWKLDYLRDVAELFNVPQALLLDPSVPLEHIRQIGEVLHSVADLPPEKIAAVLQMLAAMK